MECFSCAKIYFAPFYIAIIMFVFNALMIKPLGKTCTLMSDCCLINLGADLDSLPIYGKRTSRVSVNNRKFELQ